MPAGAGAAERRLAAGAGGAGVASLVGELTDLGEADAKIAAA